MAVSAEHCQVQSVTMASALDPLCAPLPSAFEALQKALARHAKLRCELAQAQTDITFFRAVLAKERVQELNRVYKAEVVL